MPVIKKAAVAVDRWVRSLLKGQCCINELQLTGEFRAGRVLNTMIGPENLIQTVQVNQVSDV